MRLTDLALEVAGGDDLADQPTQRLVDRLERAAGLGHALEEVDDEQLGLFLLKHSLFDYDFHLTLPLP